MILYIKNIIIQAIHNLSQTESYEHIKDAKNKKALIQKIKNQG